MTDDDRIENEMPEEDDNDEEEDDEDLPIEEIVNLMKLHEDLRAEVKRLRVQRRTLVAAARANQLHIADLTGEVYDELGSMQQQMVALAEMAMTAIDSALQWCGELSEHTGFGEDEDEDEDKEGSGSFLSHEDAEMIGTIIVRAAAAATQAERDATVIDWKALRQDLDAAGKRVSEIEDKEPAESSDSKTTN